MASLRFSGLREIASLACASRAIANVASLRLDGKASHVLAKLPVLPRLERLSAEDKLALFQRVTSVRSATCVPDNAQQLTALLETTGHSLRTSVPVQSVNAALALLFAKCKQLQRLDLSLEAHATGPPPLEPRPTVTSLCLRLSCSFWPQPQRRSAIPAAIRPILDACPRLPELRIVLRASDVLLAPLGPRKLQKLRLDCDITGRQLAPLANSAIREMCVDGFVLSRARSRDGDEPDFVPPSSLRLLDLERFSASAATSHSVNSRPNCATWGSSASAA